MIFKVFRKKINGTPDNGNNPSLFISIIPIGALLASLIFVLVWRDADAISQLSPYVLLASAFLAVLLATFVGSLDRDRMLSGIRRSARQTLPAVPLLVMIGLVSTTWMLGGIVPTLIDYGLKCLNPTFFLVLSCSICAVVSVLTGSSWTTIATVGVAFIGIGTVIGYSPGWTAGAIISGAYFGDKVSPLSDTTIIASNSCNVDLFKHIRYLMHSSIPAMTIALVVFAIVGICIGPEADTSPDPSLIAGLHRTFNITPWVLVVPAITAVLIIARISTLYVLAASSIMGLVAMFIFQPDIAATVNPVSILLIGADLDTGNTTLDSLVSTGGIRGMLPTIMLVLCAMTFGATMLGTGMIDTLARWFLRRLSKRTSIVGATVGSGLMLNACTADQYLSIIIGANMYGKVYEASGLEPRVLSRTLEDSVSVTSVLIPWNSCGVTQSTVLGVATLTYMPFCLFNILSPAMSLFLAWTGIGVRRLATQTE